MGKELKGSFFQKRYIKVQYSHEKILTIEMQNKDISTTRRYYPTPAKWLLSKNQKRDELVRRWEEKMIFSIYWWKCKLMSNVIFMETWGNS